MLNEILRFEWRYHTRQVSFLAAVLLFFCFGFALTATGFGPNNVNIDSPYSITQSIGVLSLMSLFVLAAFCSNAVVRDREYRMEEIVFSTPVAKLPFLLGRFGGAFFAAFTAFSAAALGMIAARFLPWHDRVGPFDLFAYVRALLVVALPNILFAAVVLFAIATLTRSVLASYAGSVFLYVLYFIAAAMTNSPMMAGSVPDASHSVAGLLDPFGLSAFFEQTQYWTPLLRNTHSVALQGAFLLNRLLWMGASFAGLAIVYRLFDFRAKRGAAGFSPPREEPGGLKPAAPQVAPRITGNPFQAWWSSTKIATRSALGGLPFLALVLLWVVLVAFELIADVRGGEYGSALYPTTALLESILRAPLRIIATILLVYYSTEVVWRERTVRMHEIIRATPVADVVFLLSKWFALLAMLAILTASGFLTAAVLSDPFDPALLLTFAYYDFVPLALLAAAAVAIQTLSPHKYLGMFLVLAFSLLPQLFDHNLLRFAKAPEITWSAFNGFGPFAAPVHWFLLYWGAFAALGLLRKRVPAIVFLAAGAFIFYNTNVLNRYESERALLDWKADYEKKYAPFITARPRIRAVTAAIDLEPAQRRYRVRGEYALVNETRQPIDTLLVTIRRDATRSNVTLASARLREHDTRFHQYRFEFTPPLQPGARSALRFDVTYEHRGFTNDAPDPSIVANGSYIMSNRTLPAIGYRASYEIDEPRERRRRGLREATRASQEGEIASGDWAQFDVTVSTAREQTVVAPGTLVREWQSNGRRFFHFRSEAPIPNQFAIASARYRVVREVRNGVSIEIYHHPDHGQNVPRILRAAADSLQAFSAKFTPYPHKYLRVAEVPVYWQFGGFAQPGVIFLQEQRGFLIDARDVDQRGRLDLVRRRVAHEVAHQWWGHTLVAADAPGATMLTESLTKYSELLVMDPEQVPHALAYERNLYLTGRTRETGSEPSLARVGSEDYIYYRKGALVMHAMQERIGEAALNTALRNLLQKHGGPDGKATTADLLRELYAVAPPRHHAAIHQWMNGTGPP
ncbi:MAG TPA: M1 family aminopeptidase [Thermoanaerobaculia bacterium]|nr:M1 family aminopeptidase [Thermoanaerobaculia bacterium]